MNEHVVVVLPIPNKVLSPNCMIASLGGRYMKVAATKKYRALTRASLEAEEITTAPWNYARVFPTFFHATIRRRDEDNYQGMLKAAYDGVVDSGLVEDDDSKHMRKEPPTFLVDKDYPRVELRIERML